MPLYLVASPIGHLGDIGSRALELLKSVDLIACEDTRKSRKLLSYYHIQTVFCSCHSHNERHVFLSRILPLLQKGKSVAYLSEAGTPGISDPGSILVEGAYEHGLDIYPVPGPSAVSAIVSVAGLHGKGYVFEGFLPRKGKHRKKALEDSLTSDRATVFFESPHRILRFLEEISEKDPKRVLLIAREISKIHEEYVRATVVKHLLEYKEKRREQRGEFTILVYPIKK